MVRLKHWHRAIPGIEHVFGRQSDIENKSRLCYQYVGSEAKPQHAWATANFLQI